jgi:hypothetical protein
MERGKEPKEPQRRKRPEFFDFWTWKFDPIPQGNDGTCPHCGHAHGPRFGRFWCESCGRKVGDSAAERHLVATPWWRRAAVVGAMVLAMLAFACLADPGLAARMAEIFGSGQ